MFPLSYMSWSTIIGIGFWVDTISVLNIKTLTLSGFTNSSVRAGGTLSWLALGI